MARECKTVQDVHNMLKDLFRHTVEEVLEAEMTQHLGYPKHSPEGDNSGNTRNGYSTKSVKTRMGNAEITIPRDRNADSSLRSSRSTRKTPLSSKSKSSRCTPKACPPGTSKTT